MNEVIEKIKKEYQTLVKECHHDDDNRIKRGYVPTVSKIVEDELVNYIYNINKNNRIYIDFGLSYKCIENGKTKTYRPDIIITDDNNKVLAILEVKSNMGFVRDIGDNNNFNDRIDTIKNMFKSNKEVLIITGEKTKKEIKIYGNDNLYFALVSLTKSNASANVHKKIAENIKYDYYILFDKWYGNLVKYEESLDGVKNNNCFVEKMNEILLLTK